MMKSSLMRHAAVARVASLGARSAHALSRNHISASALARSSRTSSLAISYRPINSLVRFYASESTARQDGGSFAAGGSDVVTRFEDLVSLGVHEKLVNTITQRMKFEQMTDVQARTITPGLSGKDLVAQAKTGTGKTLAFLIPVVQGIINQDPSLASPLARRAARCDDIRGIVVSPTRELAEQIAIEAQRLVAGTGVVVQVAVGGTQKSAMLHKTRREGCHLLIATPGRLHDVLSDARSGIEAPNLSSLVLDEADRMLDVGFDRELTQILDQLPNRNEVPRQTMLFSATMPKDVVGLARKYINPSSFEFVRTVSVDEVPTHERIPQRIVACRGFENVMPTVYELMKREAAKSSQPGSRPFKAILFLPTTSLVQLYFQIFRRIAQRDTLFHEVYEIHSKLTQNARQRSADRFRASHSSILISSDVTARGMDFPNVSHVIQVHMPSDQDSYIHRIGRTGRAGKEGEAWLVVGDIELGVARKRLAGLPIQRSTDLVCASTDASSESRPEEFETIRAAAERVSEELMLETYSGYLGGATKGVNREDVIDNVNTFMTQGLGMDQPPAVPRRMWENLGRPRNLRVIENHHGGMDSRDHHGGGYGDRRGGGYGDRRGGSYGRRGGDRFEQMAEPEDNRSRYGSRAPRASF